MLNVGKLRLFQVYPMSSSPRGYFFMINNVQFVNNKNTRIGAEVDETNLEELFKQFGYNVVKYRDEGLEVGTLCIHNMTEGICMCIVASLHDQ